MSEKASVLNVSHSIFNNAKYIFRVLQYHLNHVEIDYRKVKSSFDYQLLLRQTNTKKFVYLT